MHPFLQKQRFYSVAIGSLAACALIAGRVVGAYSHAYSFMLWNLALAWIPYGCSFLVAAIDHRSPRGRTLPMVVLSLVWLAFYPNAPYLVTDLLYLRGWTPIPLWYDVFMLAAFAWAGCLLGVASLCTMQRLVAKHAGELAGYVAAAVAIGLTGVGVYLGRVVRLNSWDLVLRPHRVFIGAVASLQHREGVLFTLVFSGFLSVCYVAMNAFDVRTEKAP